MYLSVLHSSVFYTEAFQIARAPAADGFAAVVVVVLGVQAQQCETCKRKAALNYTGASHGIEIGKTNKLYLHPSARRIFHYRVLMVHLRSQLYFMFANAENYTSHSDK